MDLKTMFNVYEETWGNTINFGVMSARLCAYFDHGANVRHCDIALKKIILASILVSILGIIEDSRKVSDSGETWQNLL